MDRAIDYTNRVLHTLPSYRGTAVEGLRTLREDLARRAADDPAIRKLDAYLDRLDGKA